MAQAVYRGRFAVWLLVLAGAAALWATGRPVTFNQSFEGFFPPDHRALTDYLRAKQAFGGDDFVFVAYEDERLWTPAGMDRVAGLAKRLAEIAGVVRVDSLDQMPVPWKVDAAARALVAEPLALAKVLGGLATVADEVRAAADRPDAMAELRERIGDSPLFRNLLVSADGRTTALVVRLSDPDQAETKQAVKDLRRRADAWAAERGIARVAVVGPPVLLADAFVSLEHDSERLGWVAMALMAVTMLVAVRSPWWALLPLASGWSAWLVLQAFLNAYNIELTLSSGTILVQTVVLCMPAASHLAMHFHESLHEHVPPEAAARRTLVALWAPVAWCTLTAAAGYLALLTSSVRPVFQFGLTTAIATLVAGVLAYVMAAGAMQPPRWLRLGSPAGPVAKTSATVGGLTARVLHRPARTLVLFAVPCLALAVGMGKLEFESNYIKVYRSGSRVAQDYRFVEDRLGGIGLVELVFRAPDRITPEWIDNLQATTRQLAATDPGLVSEVLSLADVLEGGARRAERGGPERGPQTGDERRKAEDGSDTIHASPRTKELVRNNAPASASGRREPTDDQGADAPRSPVKSGGSPGPDPKGQGDSKTTRLPTVANGSPDTDAPAAGGFLSGLLGGSTAAKATPERVLQTKLRLLSTPAYAHFLDHFWDHTHADGAMRVIVRIRESADAERKQRAFAQLLDVARPRLDESTIITGLSHLMTQITSALVTTQFQSTACSCAMIGIMLVVALRSVRLAVLALLPTLLSVGLVLGGMGWLGMKIDMSTALVASVAVGLSVDDTFHCLLGYKRELRAGRSSLDALRASYAGTGPGVVLSSAAVTVGFLALVFSEFIPVANFGWLVAVATLGGSLGNLVLLPACLALRSSRSVRGTTSS